MIENTNPSFESLRKKLYELYQQINDNNISINLKQLDLTSNKLENNWSQQISFIYDSDEVPNSSTINPTDVTLTDTLDTLRNYPSLLFPLSSYGISTGYYPDGIGSIQTYSPIPGTYLPFTAIYNVSVILPFVSKELLPLLEYENRFTSSGNRSVVTGFVWNEDFWDSDYYVVTYNGDQIWAGIFPPTQNLPIFDWQYTQSDDTHFAKYTTPAWYSENVKGYLLEWTSSQYDITSPTFSGGPEGYTIFTGSIYGNEVLSYDSGILTVSGVAYTIYFYLNGDSVLFNLTTTPTTYEFNLLSEDGGILTWWTPTGIHWQETQVDDGFYSSAPDVIQQGYYATYDEANTQPFYVFYNKISSPFTLMTPSISEFQWTPPTYPGQQNPPEISVDTGGPFPTSQMVEYVINPDGYPQLFSKRSGSTWPVWVQGIQTDPFYIRLNKSTDVKESWQVQYPNGCVVLAPGINSSTQSRLQWDDIYTASQYLTSNDNLNGFYEWGEATTLHNTIDLPQYEAQAADITARVRVAIRPPINWHKIDKFQQNVGG